MIPVISIVAYSGTGKTTFIEKLIPILKGRGVRVAVVKHDAHQFDLDKEGKDSDRFTKAGADITALISKDQAAFMEQRTVKPEDFMKKIDDVDLILTEGFKTGTWPKIMLHRSGTGKDLPLPPEDCLAVVSDTAVAGAKTFFDWNDTEHVFEAVVDFLLAQIGYPKEKPGDSGVIIKALAGIDLFKKTKGETLERISRVSRIKCFPKGSMIFSAKKPMSDVYIQLTGKSCIYNLTHAGYRKVIFIFGAGILLNDHVMNEHTSSCFCETMEKSEILIVPAKVFTECMEEDFALTKAVLKMQEWKLWRSTHQLKNTLGNIYMERKLAAKLWKLARDFGRKTEDGIEIDMNLSITFLSDMLGAPRETTSRICKSLSDYGLIKINKKRITIINPEKMSKLYKEGKID